MLIVGAAPTQCKVIRFTKNPEKKCFNFKTEKFLILNISRLIYNFVNFKRVAYIKTAINNKR